MKIKDPLQLFIILITLGLFIYGSYRVTKKLSYDWWYRPMVEQTIREMVKPEYLND